MRESIDFGSPAAVAGMMGAGGSLRIFEHLQGARSIDDITPTPTQPEYPAPETMSKSNFKFVAWQPVKPAPIATIRLTPGRKSQPPTAYANAAAIDLLGGPGMTFGFRIDQESKAVLISEGILTSQILEKSKAIPHLAFAMIAANMEPGLYRLTGYGDEGDFLLHEVIEE